MNKNPVTRKPKSSHLLSDDVMCVLVWCDDDLLVVKSSNDVCDQCMYEKLACNHLLIFTDIFTRKKNVKFVLNRKIKSKPGRYYGFHFVE